MDYSTGMKKKTALGCAVIHRPRLLFLDEPFSGIDPLALKGIKEVLQQMVREGVTIFFSSHVMELVERLCTRVAILHRGEIHAVGTLAEMRATLGLAGDATLEDVFVKAVGEPIGGGGGMADGVIASRGRLGVLLRLHFLLTWRPRKQGGTADWARRVLAGAPRGPCGPDGLRRVTRHDDVGGGPTGGAGFGALGGCGSASPVLHPDGLPGGDGSGRHRPEPPLPLSDHPAGHGAFRTDREDTPAPRAFRPWASSSGAPRAASGRADLPWLSRRCQRC